MREVTDPTELEICKDLDITYGQLEQLHEELVQMCYDDSRFNRRHCRDSLKGMFDQLDAVEEVLELLKENDPRDWEDGDESQASA